MSYLRQNLNDIPSANLKDPAPAARTDISVNVQRRNELHTAVQGTPRPRITQVVVSANYSRQPC